MKRTSSSLATAGLIIAILFSAPSCKREDTASGHAATANASSERATVNPSVTRVVFVGKKNACECTRKRVDDSLAVLQKALEGRSSIVLEQLQADVDEKAVAHYRKLRPIMVLPAVYLLGDSGSLVEMLQGEVTAEQVQKALGD